MHGLLSKRRNNSQSFKYPKKDICRESTEAKGREQREINNTLEIQEENSGCLFSKVPVILPSGTQ